MKNNISTLIATVAFACAALTSCSHPTRWSHSLAGEWRTELGPVTLPGTTDEAGIGDTITNLAEDSRLSRRHSLCRPLTYRTEVYIPSGAAKQHIELYIEKTKPSTLWVDGDSVGHQVQLHTPHVYDLTGIEPGKHTIELRIDNTFGPEALHPLIGGSHAVTEATQTNWNGALGEISLRAMSLTHIRKAQVTTHIVDSTIVRPLTESDAKDLEGEDLGSPDMAPTANAHVTIDVEVWAHHNCCVTMDAKCLPSPISSLAAIGQSPTTQQFDLKKGSNHITMTMDVEDVKLWSEHQQPLYELCLTLDSPDGIDKVNERFGFRSFVAGKDSHMRQFMVNGQPTMLRGKHDACVFPLTGYAPMDKASWIKVFRTAKEWGINHYRFHSWTPPEAAFAAADEVGIYLQPELPFWGVFQPSNSSPDALWLNNFLYEEGLKIVRQFGNHPSFVMMALGNEIGGDTTVMRQMVEGIRKVDGRRLYATGSNNFLGWMGQQWSDDFFVTCRVGSAWPNQSDSHARASFSFADADDAGLLNATRPNTQMNFAKAADRTHLPVVGHETCQYQIYPDYDEIEKYTGVLVPLNLINFRAGLERNHLSGLAKAFHKASGALAVKLYKADIEMCLRTPKFGGFQLLDLQDYPGQGGALVGMLDPFMDNKGLITPEAFRHFCSELVPLAQMKQLTWQAGDTLRADVAIANYTQRNLAGDELTWSIANDRGDTVAQGSMKVSARLGSLTDVGDIVVPINKELVDPAHWLLTLGLTDPILCTKNQALNTYDLWVYPTPSATTSANKSKLLRADRLTDALIHKVEAGATLLLTPRHQDVEHQSVGGMFITDYWNYAMFKRISENNKRPVSPGTLGYLISDTCALFRLFPTQSHSDFQWWAIAKASRPLIMDGTPEEVQPIVMAIDNVNRNHKLGVLFGMRVGNGRILVCMTDLEAIKSCPEGLQYATAIETYAASDNFDPTWQTTGAELRHLLTRNVEAEAIEGVENISDYKILDGK